MQLESMTIEQLRSRVRSLELQQEEVLKIVDAPAARTANVSGLLYDIRYALLKQPPITL